MERRVNDISIAKQRAERTDTRLQQIQAAKAIATDMKRAGYSNVAIAQRLGASESTVRKLLKR